MVDVESRVLVLVFKFRVIGLYVKSYFVILSFF